MTDNCQSPLNTTANHCEVGGWERERVSLQRIQCFDSNEKESSAMEIISAHSLIDYEMKKEKRLICGAKQLRKIN